MKKFSTPQLREEKQYVIDSRSECDVKTIGILMFVFLMFVFTMSVFAQNSVSTHAGSSQGYLDATGSSARFQAPTGICISPDGQFIYVADYSGHRIRKINVASKAVTTVAGNGTMGYADGVGTAAKFSYPSGISISTTGDALYISDYGNSYIRKIVLSTGTVSTIAGTGAFGYADHTNGLSAVFNAPTDVVNSGDSVLYISDTENHLIRKLNLSSSEVSTVAGMAGVPGFQNGTGTGAAFRFPKGLAISADGATLYVADNGNNMIRSISLSTANVGTVAGDGTPGYADNANGSLAKLNGPNGVAVVPGMPDVLFVADNINHRLRRISISSTAVTTIAGTGAVPPASTFGDNTNGMSAKFFYPTNLVVSPDGQDLYVADQGNFRVRKVKTDLSSGISDAFYGEPFTLFPNPVTDYFTLRANAAGTESIRLELFDVTGSRVRFYENQHINGEYIFHEDISFLPDGIYFLRIQQGLKQATQRLVVSR